MRHRLEDTMELVNRGRMEIPEDIPDVAAFLLSDGKISNPRRPAKRMFVGDLFTQNSVSLPENAITKETLRVAQIHMRYVARIVGEKRN